ncbi:hypothetical protein DLM85_14920 [Hymenobacter edaphi]|uniref:Uncharacterized protein n=1 Tax=Hymenobacter edaphi TaxID=2211146 RepID=A0A328BJ38_9BACT|nr:hypothetical protein DLM85_14920 [Hymenobacter edaphi]
MTKVLRTLKYLLSTTILLLLTVFRSPYKDYYGAIGRYYFNDDAIFFGLILSFGGLMLHLPSVLASGFPPRGLRDISNGCFALLYIGWLGYWVYYLTSDAAMHEAG